MATVVTSIGSNSSIDTETPSSCSGSYSPYDVTFETDPTGVSVGDRVEITDEGFYWGTFVYRVTAIDGSTYTLAYVTDDAGNGDASPCELIDMSYEQAPATFKRFYDNIDDWSDGLSDSDVYASSDDAVGECHNDSEFSGAYIIDPSITFSSITLTSHIDSRHDGTKGSGVVLNCGGGTDYPLVTIGVKVDNVRISWLEFDGKYGVGQPYRISNGNAIQTLSGVSGLVVDHNLFYDYIFNTADSRPQAIVYNASTNKITIHNNMIWSVDSSGSYPLYIFYSSQAETGVLAYNNTIYDITSSGDAGGSILSNNIVTDDTAEVKNLILMDWSDVTLHTTSTVDITLDYFGLEATHSDVDNVTVATVANTFKDSTTTDPNLHLKTTSNFIGAAVDLGTTPDDVEFDIDNFDRDTSGNAWDLGADQVPRTDVAPTAASFELAGVSPSVGQSSLTITVAVAAFALAGITPTAVPGSISLTPTVAAVELDAVSPSVNLSSVTVSPAAAAFELAGVSPSVELGSLSITPSVAVFELTGVDPTVDIHIPLVIEPTVAAFELAALDPSVLGPIEVTAAAFELAGVSPSVELDSISITPTVAAFELTGVDPTIDIYIPLVIEPIAATFELTGVNPSVLTPIFVTPAITSFELAGVTPTSLAGSLSITPSVAVVEFVATNSPNFTPAASAFELVGVSPSTILSNLSITPTVAALKFAAVSPSVTRGSVSVTPATAVINYRATYGSVIFGGIVVIPVTEAQFVYAAVDPAVGMSSQTVAPTASAFELEGVTPSTIKGSITVSPAVSVVEFAASVATINAGVEVTPAVAAFEYVVGSFTLHVDIASASLGYACDGLVDYRGSIPCDYEITGVLDYIGGVLPTDYQLEKNLDYSYDHQS